MEFKLIQQRALEIRRKYSQLESKKNGKPWTRSQVMEGFVGDVGDLMKLVMAKDGIRDIENVDEKLRHELSDCLWAVIVLADAYGVELEASFMRSMKDLEERIDKEDK